MNEQEIKNKYWKLLEFCGNCFAVAISGSVVFLIVIIALALFAPDYIKPILLKMGAILLLLLCSTSPIVVSKIIFILSNIQGKIKHWFFEEHKGTRRDELIMFITLIFVLLLAVVERLLEKLGIASLEYWTFALLMIAISIIIYSFMFKEQIKTNLKEESTPTGEEP